MTRYPSKDDVLASLRQHAGKELADGDGVSDALAQAAHESSVNLNGGFDPKNQGIAR